MTDPRQRESYKDEIARTYSWARFWQWLKKATDDNLWIFLVGFPDGCLLIALGIAAAAVAGFTVLIS